MTPDPDPLFAYEPNVTRWLTAADDRRLAAIEPPRASGQPAGTHARRILDRLLIDLSYESSRLEGTPTRGSTRAG